MSPTHQEEEDLRQLAELYRAHPPEGPAEAAWTSVLAGILRAQPTPPVPGGAGWWGPLVGACAVAAVLALALLFPPPPPTTVPLPPSVAVEDEKPFAVAATAEIFILKADPADAERIALGQPVMGAFEVTAPNEVKMVGVQVNPDGETLPWLHSSSQLSMIIGTPDEDERQ